MHYVCIVLTLTGMFYYMLGNIRPELRSTHRSIQLIACVTSPNLEKYGFHAVLDPFVKDVNKLANVCEFEFCIAMYTLLFSVIHRLALILRWTGRCLVSMEVSWLC